MSKTHYDGRVSIMPIRTYGDPVLKEVTKDVTNIDGALASLVERMLETMYAAPGVGLAANQVGVQRRLFVYDIDDDPKVVINPHIVESDGEWTYEEGCLSVPGLSFEITRPKTVHLVGIDLEGNELSIEADEFEARVFQHELDHLEGILLVERLDPDQRKKVKKLLAKRALDRPLSDPDGIFTVFDR